MQPKINELKGKVNRLRGKANGMATDEMINIGEAGISRELG
jgi:hypothetical protein